MRDINIGDCVTVDWGDGKPSLLIYFVVQKLSELPPSIVVIREGIRPVRISVNAVCDVVPEPRMMTCE